MADRKLGVWLYGRQIGHLEQIDGRLSFRYEADWLAQGDAQPLSLSLPLRGEPFDDRAARPFFAGLLPEQDQRDRVARALGVSSRNDFALLEGIGGECAGAVTFVHPGEQPASDSSANYRRLDDAELAAILKDLPSRPLLAGQKDVRLSLAGAQNKLPVFLDGEGRIALPLNGAPSSHILKPAIERIDGSVVNEAFCLALARALDFDAVNAEIRQVEGQTFLLVQRYDREKSPAGERRLHQEDFCQALGVAPELKYQNEGGPSLADCFALVRRASTPPALYLPRLLDAAVFNALIGNNDAHGKNFSLVYAGGGVRLSPIYDVLCTAIYPNLSLRMAMKIGGYYEFEKLLPRHWAQMAKEAGLSEAAVRRRIVALAGRMPGRAETLKNEFAGSAPILERVVALIRTRCEATVRLFAERNA